MANLHFSDGNNLLPSTDEYKLRIFNLPAVALREEDGGEIICCEAPECCKRICYAKRDQRWPNVYKNRRENYEFSLGNDFVESVKRDVDETLRKYAHSDAQIVYRIHESGDFYSDEYLAKWVEIANSYRGNAKIVFMAYTKSIELLKTFLEKRNMVLSDINIKFKFSVIRCDKDESKNTSPDKMKIAEELRAQGLTYYTLYANEESVSPESDTRKHCHMDKGGESCATCHMKCYYEDVDIDAIVK